MVDPGTNLHKFTTGTQAPSVNESLLQHVVEEDSLVRAYVRSVTQGHRETEDVIQNIWQVACRKIDEYDRTRPFRGWVMGIARLEVLKWRQRLARSREILAPDVIELLADTAEQYREELDVRSQHLRDCLDTLPSLSRTLLKLKYFDGMKIEEMARKVSKKTAAVEMALVRVRRLLRSCIEDKLRGTEKVRL